MTPVWLVLLSLTRGGRKNRIPSLRVRKQRAWVWAVRPEVQRGCLGACLVAGAAARASASPLLCSRGGGRGPWSQSSQPFLKDLARLSGKVGRTEEPWLGLAPGCPPRGPTGPHSVLRPYRPLQAAPITGDYLSLSLDFLCYVDKTLRWAEAPRTPSCRPPSIRLSGLSQRRPNHDHEPAASPGSSASSEPKLLRGQAFQVALVSREGPRVWGCLCLEGASHLLAESGATSATALRLRWRLVCMHACVRVSLYMRVCVCVSA